MSGFYNSALDGFLTGALDVTPDLTAQAVDVSYTFSAAHTALADLAGQVGSPSTLTGVAVSAGVISADDPVFPDIPLGNTVRGIAFYLAGGGDLICFINLTPGGTTLAYTSDGTSATATLPGGRIATI